MVRAVSTMVLALLLAIGAIAANIGSPVDVDNGAVVVQSPLNDTLSAEAGGNYTVHWHYGWTWCTQFQWNSNSCRWYPRSECRWISSTNRYVVQNWVAFYQTNPQITYLVAAKNVYYYQSSCSLIQ